MWLRGGRARLGLGVGLQGEAGGKLSLGAYKEGMAEWIGMAGARAGRWQLAPSVHSQGAEGGPRRTVGPSGWPGGLRESTAEAHWGKAVGWRPKTSGSSIKPVFCCSNLCLALRYQVHDVTHTKKF
jgi:hypothetical protein